MGGPGGRDRSSSRIWRLRRASLSILLVSACTAGNPGPSLEADGSPGPLASAQTASTPASARRVANPMYACLRRPFELAAIDGAAVAHTVDRPSAAALRDAVASGALDIENVDASWWLLGEDDDSASYLTRTEDAYFEVAFERVGAGWSPTASGACELSLVIDSVHGAARWTWDPAGPRPSRTTTTFGAIVSEVACSTGRSADARLRGPLIVTRADRIEIGFAVAPLEGPQDCEAADPSLVRIALPEPLGDRVLVDSGIVPPGDPTPESIPPTVPFDDLPAPRLPEPLTGRATILELEGSSGEPPVVGRVALPPGTDDMTVALACSGNGDVVMVIDGLRYERGCAAGISELVPRTDLVVDVAIQASGSVRWAARFEALDLDTNPFTRFVPPVIQLAGVDAFGVRGSAIGHPGCGWYWEPADGSGFADDCGPSWQAIPDNRALTVSAGSMLTLSLAGDWALTQLSVAIADHDRIIPSGNDPVATALDVGNVRGATATFPAPDVAGDWGLRIYVGGERPSESYGLPYYFRIHVED